MYIIVNGSPINIYYSTISTIIENNVDNLSSACEYIINPRGTGKYVANIYMKLGSVMSRRGWVKFEEVTENIYYDNFSKSQLYFRQSNYSRDKFYKAEFKKGYFFYVQDNMNFVISQLYSTKEEAEDKLNNIIAKINEITAKDIKFNV